MTYHFSNVVVMSKFISQVKSLAIFILLDLKCRAETTYYIYCSNTVLSEAERQLVFLKSVTVSNLHFSSVCSNFLTVIFIEQFCRLARFLNASLKKLISSDELSISFFIIFSWSCLLVLGLFEILKYSVCTILTLLSVWVVSLMPEASVI